MEKKFINKYYDSLLKHTDRVLNSNGYNNSNLVVDFLNDIFLYLYEKKKWIRKENQEEFNINNLKLIKYIINVQGSSSSSPFFTKYVSPNKGYYYLNKYENYNINKIDEDFIEEKIEFEEKLKKIDNILDDKNIFEYYGEVAIFKLYYYENFTYREIVELTSIGFNTIFDIVKNAREKIKKNL